MRVNSRIRVGSWLGMKTRFIAGADYVPVAKNDEFVWIRSRNKQLSKMLRNGDNSSAGVIKTTLEELQAALDKLEEKHDQFEPKVPYSDFGDVSPDSR